MKIKKITKIAIGRPDQIADVDFDIESSRRDDVKNYMSIRFGIDSTSSVGSYTRLKLKQAIKDFAKIKGLKFSYVNFITKSIGNQLDYVWEDIFKYSLLELEKKEESRHLYNFVQNNSDIIMALKNAINSPKSNSVHASASLILPKEDEDGLKMSIFDWMPVRKVDGVLVSEWEGKYVDRAGFLKEDVLALAQLDKFKNILRLIKKNHNKDINLTKIPFDDKKVYELFHKGYNEDVFQFTSHGLKKFSRNVLPDTLDELVAMTALYRPGPMKSHAHTDFYEIKFGKKQPEYDHMLREVTESTYGLYVYQEQVMKAVHVLGKLTLIEADNVRTIIKKKDKVKMAEFKGKFLKGANENGCSDEEANRVWDKLDKFSAYSFNKSHSQAYSMMSYYCQWLKANYPLEFWTTALQFVKSEEYIPERLSELKKVSKHISVKPPDINKSTSVFEADSVSNTIYWNLSSIKGIGAAATNGIIQARKAGEFKSLEDFVQRKNKINKSSITTLIVAGCFDEVECIVEPKQRKSLLLKYYQLIKEDLPIILDEEDSNKNAYWTLKQKSLTGFGEIDYSVILRKLKLSLYNKYVEPKEFLKPKQNWREVVVAGQLILIRESSTRIGVLASLVLSCNNELINVTLWADTWEQEKEKTLKLKNKLVAIYGKIKADDHKGVNVLYSCDETKIIPL